MEYLRMLRRGRNSTEAPGGGGKAPADGDSSGTGSSRRSSSKSDRDREQRRKSVGPEFAAAADRSANPPTAVVEPRPAGAAADRTAATPLVATVRNLQTHAGAGALHRHLQASTPDIRYHTVVGQRHAQQQQGYADQHHHRPQQQQEHAMGSLSVEKQRPARVSRMRQSLPREEPCVGQLEWQQQQQPQQRNEAGADADCCNDCEHAQDAPGGRLAKSQSSNRVRRSRTFYERTGEEAHGGHCQPPPAYSQLGPSSVHRARARAAQRLRDYQQQQHHGDVPSPPPAAGVGQMRRSVSIGVNAGGFELGYDHHVVEQAAGAEESSCERIPHAIPPEAAGSGRRDTLESSLDTSLDRDDFRSHGNIREPPPHHRRPAYPPCDYAHVYSTPEQQQQHPHSRAYGAAAARNLGQPQHWVPPSTDPRRKPTLSATNPLMAIDSTSRNQSIDSGIPDSDAADRLQLRAHVDKLARKLARSKRELDGYRAERDRDRIDRITMTEQLHMARRDSDQHRHEADRNLLLLKDCQRLLADKERLIDKLQATAAALRRAAESQLTADEVRLVTSELDWLRLQNDALSSALGVTETERDELRHAVKSLQQKSVSKSQPSLLPKAASYSQHMARAANPMAVGAKSLLHHSASSTCSTLGREREQQARGEPRAAGSSSRKSAEQDAEYVAAGGGADADGAKREMIRQGDTLRVCAKELRNLVLAAQTALKRRPVDVQLLLGGTTSDSDADAPQSQGAADPMSLSAAELAARNTRLTARCRHELDTLVRASAQICTQGAVEAAGPCRVQ